MPSSPPPSLTTSTNKPSVGRHQLQLCQDPGRSGAWRDSFTRMGSDGCCLWVPSTQHSEAGPPAYEISIRPLNPFDGWGHPASQVGQTLQLVAESLVSYTTSRFTPLRDRLHRRRGPRAWGQSPQHTWPLGVLTLTLEAAGEVGQASPQVSSPLGASEHHSWRQEVWLETASGNAFSLGIPVRVSFQGSVKLWQESWAGTGRARAHLRARRHPGHLSLVAE